MTETIETQEKNIEGMKQKLIGELKDEFVQVSTDSQAGERSTAYRAEQFDQFQGELNQLLKTSINAVEGMKSKYEDVRKIKQFITNESNQMEVALNDKRMKGIEEIESIMVEFAHNWQTKRPYAKPQLEQLHREDFKFYMATMDDGAVCNYIDSIRKAPTLHQFNTMLQRVNEFPNQSEREQYVTKLRVLGNKLHVGKEYRLSDQYKALEDVLKKFQTVPQRKIKYNNEWDSFAGHMKKVLGNYDVRHNHL